MGYLAERKVPIIVSPIKHPKTRKWRTEIILEWKDTFRAAGGPALHDTNKLTSEHRERYWNGLDRRREKTEGKRTNLPCMEMDLLSLLEGL